VRFETLTAVLLKIQVVWDTTLCWWWAVADDAKDHNALILRGNMKALWYSATLGTIHPVAQQHIPEDLNIHMYYCLFEFQFLMLPNLCVCTAYHVKFCIKFPIYMGL